MRRRDALAVVLRLGQGLRGVQPGVLPQADGPLPLARGGGVDRAAAVLQDAGHVVAVQDAELGLEAQHRAVLAHHAHAQGVKGADQHLLGAPADQPLGALAHLGGGLVGERDGGDALGLHPGLDQPGDLVRDHPRLAGAGAGQYQAGAVHEVHGFLLGEIETGRHAGGGRREARGRVWAERRIIPGRGLWPGPCRCARVSQKIAPFGRRT